MNFVKFIKKNDINSIPNILNATLEEDNNYSTTYNQQKNVLNRSLNSWFESYLFWDILDCLGTSDETSSSGGDETDLLTWGSESANCSGLTQMLVVTTSVGMVHGVHSHTSDSWESLSQSLELVEQSTSLHDRLLVSSSTGDDTNGGSAEPWDGLSGTWWESDSGSATIIWVSDNGGVGSWTSGVSTLVSDCGFDVADGGTFWDSVDWEDVTGGDGSFSASEYILSGVGSFSSEEIFGVMFIFIRVSEIDFDEWAATSWIVEDSSDDSLDVSFSFDKIKISVSWWCNSLWFGSGINATHFTLSLAWD